MRSRVYEFAYVSNQLSDSYQPTITEWRIYETYAIRDSGDHSTCMRCINLASNERDLHGVNCYFM